MADEPRRSGRPTKGQHTKMDALEQTPEPKKKGGKRGKKQAAQEEEVEVIRCVCGATATAGDEDPEPWIACDTCGVWQHNVCMGIPTYEDEIPEKYECEEDAPQQHKELLASIARGERIWENRRRAYEKMQAEEQEEEAPKKKGKKGKAKRQSDPKSEISASNGKAKSPSVPVPDTKKERKETPVRGGSTKRKTRDESHEENLAKSRRVSTAHATPKQKSPPSDLPVKIVELDHARQGPAKLINKALLQNIPHAVQKKDYAYSPGDTLESKSERLSIQVENAVWTSHPNQSAYTKQCRILGANLKQNQELCNKLLAKRLTPAALAIMSSDDMMTKELKTQTDEMKAISDKQAIMVTDDGPRVRRTHKGEEMVEGDSFAVPNDSVMSTSRRRSMLDPNGDMAARSRENSPGNDVELPGDINDYRSRDDIRGHAKPKPPLNIETKPAPARKASMQNDFDFNKVMSSVQSPTGPTSHIRRASVNAPPANGPGVDADVDRLLEDDNDSEPYSPADYDADPDIVWRGLVNMDTVANFPAVARHIGGADLSHTMTPPIPYTDLLLKELKIAGRIDVDKANEYLCSLRYAPPVDVVIVALAPTGEIAAKGYRDIYDYFYTKLRYGVLTNKGVGNIRDTYLVPIPPSPAQLPDFIANLEGHKIPDDRPDPMLCVALVVRTQWDPPQDRSFDGSVDPSSPLQNIPQRQMSISGAAPSMSPITQQGSFSAPNPATPSHYVQQVPDPRLAEEQRQYLQRQGEQTAARILGPHLAAPTMRFILPQAFQMRELEWEIIRGILETDERSQQDLQHLSQVLDRKMRESGNGTTEPPSQA